AEAPLFVRKGYGFNGQLRMDALIFDRAQAFEGSHDAERAVEASAIGHRIEMRTGQNSWAAFAQSCVNIPGRVDPVLETRVVEALPVPAAGLKIGFAERGTPHPSFWCFADFAEIF